MPKHLDIAICGCGPAGLAAALLLHRAGHRIRIFEQFAQPQPVGSGLLLQPTGLAVLAELNLLDTVVALGARINRLYGVAVPSERVALDVRYRAMGEGWQALGVHRALLFDALHNAARAANISIQNSTSIERSKFASGKVELYAKNNGRLGKFDLVVNALGAYSPLSANIACRTILDYGALWTNVRLPTEGFHADTLEQRYRRASHMTGVLPIGKHGVDQTMQAAFFWSMKRGALAAWRNATLSEWKAEIAALWPAAASLLNDINSHEQLTFAQYDHFTARTPFTAGVVHIGDAAHATSPQLGQGANMALLDALALARALASHPDPTDALPAYAKMRRWHVRLFQYASAIFTPFYQSDSRFLPFLRDWVTAPLSRLPIGDVVVARLVSGMTTAPLARTRFAPVRLATLAHIE
jgi:salicylate hydroxylase